MLTARYQGPGRIAVLDERSRPPAPGEVQVDVAYTGICGTDLHVFHGAMDGRVPQHAVLGHEMSGRVRALGADVAGWSPGDPVTVMPLRWCEDCPACDAGHQHICHRLDFVGIDSPGSLQQRWNVPADLLVGLPAGLALDRAALVEPTAVAVHDVRRAGLAEGELAVVIGAGPVGLLVAAVSRVRGARVLVTEPDPRRRGTARSLGIDVLDPENGDPADQVDELSGRRGADVVFEVSGTQAGIDSAVRMASSRGRVVVVGIHPTPRSVDLFRVFWRELALHGARVYRREDVDEAVGLIADGAVPVGSLISHVLPIAQAAEGFRLLDAGTGAMKVLIRCSDDD